MPYSETMRIALKSMDERNVNVKVTGDEYLAKEITSLLRLLLRVSSWQETPCAKE